MIVPLWQATSRYWAEAVMSAIESLLCMDMELMGNVSSRELSSSLSS